MKSGNVTTISIPKELKRKLDELKGDRTYTEFLEGLLQVFSPEVVDELDLLRRPGEGYGDVVLGILRAKRRDPSELEGFLQMARFLKKSGKVRVVGKGPEKKFIVQPPR